MVKHWPFRDKSARAAIHGHAFEITVGIFSRSWDLIEVENQVVRDEQIQPAVAVVVHPRATTAPALPGMRQAGRLRYIRERAVAVVAVQDVLRPAGDKKILETVVVVVADGHAACPALAHQARFRGHIRESSVAVVFVKPVGCPFHRSFAARPRQ